MNSIVIKGRVSKDVELKTIGDGKEVANFSVAVNRRFKKDEADFFNVVAWGKTGVFINTFFKKGQEIILHGEMQCRKWTDADGKNRYAWDLLADLAEFCGSKNDSNNSVSTQSDPLQSFIADNSNFEEISMGDDDLPF